MTDFSEDFVYAFNHTMRYEVGSFWDPTDPEVIAGLIETKQQRRKVGYVNIPEDTGGETKYGVAKNGNPDTDITTLDLAGAMEIYYKRYWLAGSCDELEGGVAIIHFDGCVNHGVKRANKFLQMAANVPSENVDGDIGPGTLRHVGEITPEDLIASVTGQRDKFYHSIVANRPNQVKFLNGWMARIADVSSFALSKV